MALRPSFGGFLTVFVLILAIVPALTIWFILSGIMDSSLDLLDQTTTESLTTMARQVQHQTLATATDLLVKRLHEGEQEMANQIAFAKTTGLLSMDLKPSADLLPTLLATYNRKLFADIKARVALNNLVVNTLYMAPGFPKPMRSVGVAYQAFVFRGLRVLANVDSSMHPSGKFLDVTVYSTNPITGANTEVLRSYKAPPQFGLSKAPIDGANGWATDLNFNEKSGQLELVNMQWLPAANNTLLEVSLSFNVQTISAELRDALKVHPEDRLVLFFRQPHGHLIGASHGKFYSKSDIDSRTINPLTNPPNLSDYQTYTCLNSTDILIHDACAKLYERFDRSWSKIPELNEEMVLDGQRYWVAVGWIPANINATVIVLKNRASVMGSIEASNAQVQACASTTPPVPYIVGLLVRLCANSNSVRIRPNSEVSFANSHYDSVEIEFARIRTISNSVRIRSNSNDIRREQNRLGDIEVHPLESPPSYPIISFNCKDATFAKMWATETTRNRGLTGPPKHVLHVHSNTPVMEKVGSDCGMGHHTHQTQSPTWPTCLLGADVSKRLGDRAP